MLIQGQPICLMCSRHDSVSSILTLAPSNHVRIAAAVTATVCLLGVCKQQQFQLGLAIGNCLPGEYHCCCNINHSPACCMQAMAVSAPQHAPGVMELMHFAISIITPGGYCCCCNFSCLSTCCLQAMPVLISLC